MKLLQIFPALLLLCAVVACTSAASAATISVTPSGAASVFTIQGNSMDGVAGIQLDIAYDAASLSAPTVTQGDLVSGAMFAANTSRPGSIKVAIIRTTAFTGSGQVARIAFASGSGSITSFTYTMIDGAGSTFATSAAPLPQEAAAPEAIATAGVPFSQPNQTATTVTTTATAAATTTLSSPGTVTLPTEPQHQPEPATTPPATVPEYAEVPTPARVAEQAEPSAKPAAEVKPEETAQYIVYKGVIDRFKQFKENKTLPALTALFDKKITQNIRQEPGLLLSNGLEKASVIVDIPASIGTSPNFAANGGKLISFMQDKSVKGRWIVEVLPAANSVRVTVTIIIGADEFEYPLTVSAPVKTALTLDDSGWATFIKEVGTLEAPLHDFNNDGIRDYVDEYMFVANLLARKSTLAIPVSPPAPKSAQ